MNQDPPVETSSDPVQREFGALRSSVDREVDVDAALAELHRRSAHRPRRAAWGAAAASVALVAGGVALWQTRDDTTTVTADRVPSVSIDPDPWDAFCAEQPAYVYLAPGATPEQYLCDESGRFTGVGFRIFIDGQPVPAREIAGALASVVTTGAEERVGQFERRAAAQVVSNRLLTDHGRRHGARVTDADITAAILEADSLVDSFAPGVSIDPEDAVDDPDVRARVGEALERSRGLALLLDGRSFADPAAVDDVRAWLVEQLDSRGVEASTPSSAMSHAELIDLAFDWPAE